MSKKSAEEARQRVERASDIRDLVHNLDLSQPGNQEIYEKKLYEFISRNEGVEHTAYPDSKKNITVGIGFNMDSGKDEKIWTAKEEWKKIFPNKDDPSFDDVYRGKRLSDAEIMKLYKISIETRRRELKTIYGSAWDVFKPNERMAIEDIYFNGGPTLAGRGTKFAANMKSYAETGQEEFLKKAVYEIEKNSNKDKVPGLQYRQDAQGSLLNSTLCPLYSKPGEPFLPPTAQMEAVLEETVVPFVSYQTVREVVARFIRKGLSFNPATLEPEEHPDLYIWRTCLDGKVRINHRNHEGKIFSKSAPPSTGNPGEDYNCRCWADHRIPSWIRVTVKG